MTPQMQLSMLSVNRPECRTSPYVLTLKGKWRSSHRVTVKQRFSCTFMVLNQLEDILGGFPKCTRMAILLNIGSRGFILWELNTPVQNVTPSGNRTFASHNLWFQVQLTLPSGLCWHLRWKCPELRHMRKKPIFAPVLHLGYVTVVFSM